MIYWSDGKLQPNFAKDPHIAEDPFRLTSTYLLPILEWGEAEMKNKPSAAEFLKH